MVTNVTNSKQKSLFTKRDSNVYVLY